MDVDTNRGLSSFEALHALRIKGIATIESLSECLGAEPEVVQRQLEALAAEGLVVHRNGQQLQGWTLTDAGDARHAEEIAGQQTPEMLDGLQQVYARFLPVNASLKALATRWQMRNPSDATARWEVVDELMDLHEAAKSVFAQAAQSAPRFARYVRRLDLALERLNGGDDRAFTNPRVDSYHNIWFESHEDFLVTLGIDRVAEGSS